VRSALRSLSSTKGVLRVSECCSSSSPRADDDGAVEVVDLAESTDPEPGELGEQER